MGFKVGNPDCACCEKYTISVAFIDLPGKGSYCLTPGGRATATVTGTTDAGASFSGTYSWNYVVINASRYNPLIHTGSQIAKSIPNGKYHVHITADYQACAGTFRFQGDTDVVVGQQPNPTPAVPIHSAFDIGSVQSNFALTGCGGPSTPAVMTVNYNVQGSNSACGATYSSDGNVNVECVIKSYPLTVNFDASCPDYLPESATSSGTLDPSTITYEFTGHLCTQTRATNTCKGLFQYLCYKYIPVGASCCIPGGYFEPYGAQGLPKATITVSGGITGSVTTGDSGSATLVLTGYDCSQRIVWNQTHPRTQGLSYQAAVPGICQESPSVGPPASGFVCGGCPQPLPTTLTATVMGETFTMGYVDAGYGPYDPAPYGTNGSWIGGFVKKVWSYTCNDPKNDPYQASEAAINFQVSFGGLFLSSDGHGGTALYGIAGIGVQSNQQGGFGGPSQCGKYFGGLNLVPPSYDNTAGFGTGSCNPFNFSSY